MEISVVVIKFKSGRVLIVGDSKELDYMNMDWGLEIANNLVVNTEENIESSFLSTVSI